MAERKEADLPFAARIASRRWLSDVTFELTLDKPAGFVFRAGQKVFCAVREMSREYTLACAPEEEVLTLCIRRIEGGGLSETLASMSIGETIGLSQPAGFFLHRPGKSVFVATGTGIAPFVAFCRSGVRGYVLLHGVGSAAELYYRDLLSAAARLYVPCISGIMDDGRADETIYGGRVTDYLRDVLPGESWNFYLCGNGEMIRDAIRIIDKAYPDARIFTEIFYQEDRGV